MLFCRSLPPIRASGGAHCEDKGATWAHIQSRDSVCGAQPRIRSTPPQEGSQPPARGDFLHGRAVRPSGGPHHKPNKTRNGTAGGGDAGGTPHPHTKTHNCVTRPPWHAPKTERTNGGLLIPIQGGKRHLRNRQDSHLWKSRRHARRHRHMPPTRMLLDTARGPEKFDEETEDFMTLWFAMMCLTVFLFQQL